MNARPTIGFIGLGIMGRPMAAHLAAAGYPLVVHSRSPQPVAELVAQGAQAAPSPRRVAAQAQVIITMLPDSPDVEAVVLGPDGVLEGARAGSLFIDMSTISPSVAVRLAEAGRPKDIRVLDAPVSGGDVGARNASLTIMVGGDASDFEAALPILQTLGRNIVWCGSHGAGQTVKACNQLLVAITIEGVAEALTLGTKAGVDPAKIVQVLSGGMARCGVLELRGQRMVARDFTPGFRSRLHYKDLRIALAAGQAFEVALPATALVHEMFKSLVVAGRGDLDHTALLTRLEDLAGMA